MSEKTYIDLGLVTAYAYAKEHGYTGTEEEFGEEQAKFAENAQQVAEDRVAVREDRTHVDDVVETFTETTAPEAVQRVTDEGDTQVARVRGVGNTAVQSVNDAKDQALQDIDDAGDSEVGDIQDEGNTQVGLVRGEGTTQVGNVNTAGTTQTNAVNQAGTTQTNAVNQEGTTQVGLVRTEGATQVQNVEDKGQEIIDSLPPNYEEEMAQVEDFLENLVKVSDTQPTSEANKLWIEDQAEEEIEVPTYAEFEDVADDVDDLNKSLDITRTYKTASGDIVSFDDGVAGKRIAKMETVLEPQQDLHGYDNPWPGGGGKNLFDKDGTSSWTARYYLSSTGEEVSNSAWYISDYIPISGTTVTLSNVGGNNPAICLYDANKNFLVGQNYGTRDIQTLGNITITSQTEASFVRFSIAQAYDLSLVQLELGSSATSYAPYANICPISGYDGMNVNRTGTNLFDVATNYVEQGRITAGGVDTSSSTRIRTHGFVSVYGNTVYTISANGVNRVVVYEFKKNQSISHVYNALSPLPYTFTTVSDAAFVRFVFGMDTDAEITPSVISDIQLEFGSTASTYEEYHGETIQVTFPSTVYGGTDEFVSGAMVKTRDKLVLDENIPSGANGIRAVTVLADGVRCEYYQYRAIGMGNNATFISDVFKNAPIETGIPFRVANGSGDGRMFLSLPLEYDTEEKIRAYFAANPAEFVYYLATPQEITHNPVTLTTLEGRNNIWLDSASISECKYVSDTKSVIDILMPDATEEDIGKALIVKAVDSETGKPSEYEYGETGGDVFSCAPVIINTASGDIASFSDGADNRQIKKVVGTIVPVQSGTGDPSPDNVRPISGWKGANIYSGQNLIDSLSYFVGKSGITIDGDNTNGYTLTGLASKLRAVEIPIPDTLIGKTIQITSTMSPKTNGNIKWSVIIGESISNLNSTIVSTGNVQRVSGTVTVTQSGGKFKLDYSTGDKEASVSDIMISGVGTGEYAPYSATASLPINWQTEAGTIYSGTVTLNEDGSADVVATDADVDLGTLSWSSAPTAVSGKNRFIADVPGLKIGSNINALCSQYKKIATTYDALNTGFALHGTLARILIYDETLSSATAAEFKTAMSGVQFVYELATPQTYHFSDIGQLYTYLGTNNVWIDTGAITECDYPADTKLYIDNKIAEAIAAL